MLFVVVLFVLAPCCFCWCLYSLLLPSSLVQACSTPGMLMYLVSYFGLPHLYKMEDSGGEPPPKKNDEALNLNHRLHYHTQMNRLALHLRTY